MGRFLLETQATPTISATDHANPNSDVKNIARLDTNMMIILAALLCALICALGLNSLLRYVLRCSRRFNPNEDPVDTNVAKGMKKREMKLIPVESYSLELHIKALECLICLGEFVEGEKVRVLPKCNHGFHVKCIDTWLLSNSSCPTCRQSVLEQQTPDDNVAVASGNV